MMTRILKIMLWGREVGRLSIDTRRGLPYFEYNPEWIESGLDIAPLNASIKLPQNLRPIFGASERIYQERRHPSGAEAAFGRGGWQGGLDNQHQKV